MDLKNCSKKNLTLCRKKERSFLGDSSLQPNSTSPTTASPTKSKRFSSLKKDKLLSDYSLTYITSALEPSSWPRLLDPNGSPLPEIALAGRSNVGKSTFINLLAGRKAMAKVSSTPGKTQRMQFFHANNRIVIADLPGYGYAKAPLELQAEWSAGIDIYLRTRSTLQLLVLLLDIRRDPSHDDLKLLDWAKQNPSLKVFPIFTKTDLLSKNECESRKAKALDKLAPFFSSDIPLSVPAPRRLVWTILTKKIYATV